MHIPVMLNETTELLNPMPGKTIVDCTLGFGGHAASLLSHGAEVVGIDQDQDALAEVKKSFVGNNNITFIHDNFSNIKNIVKRSVDGFLFDLGVSSYQIDEPARGFSIRSEGPLDMRMDKSKSMTASDILNNYSKEELEKIFFEFGEEKFSRRISSAVIERRKIKEIETTKELKELVEKAIPTWKKRESVTRIFQALRISVNSELANFSQALEGSVGLLNKGGRIAVISYHSLEDRIVKRFFVEQKKNGILNMLTKKPIVAKDIEVESNPRAKSAKLRVAEKA